MKQDVTVSPELKGSYILATDDKIIFIGEIKSPTDDNDTD